MGEKRPKRNPKDKADVPPVLPNEQPGGNNDGKVLSPDDLDITTSPYVEEVSDGRFVVSADGTPPSVPQKPKDQQRREHTRSTTSQEQNDSERPKKSTAPIQSPSKARSVLAKELEHADSQYAVDIVSLLDGNEVRHRTTSDDLVATFDNLLLWYAQNVATETPTQRTLSALLAKSEFATQPSAKEIRRLAMSYGLHKDSTIGELVDKLDSEPNPKSD